MSRARLEGWARQFRRGLEAPVRPLVLGALAAMGISLPATVVLGFLVGPLGAVALGLGVQLVAGYTLAGRLWRGDAG